MDGGFFTIAITNGCIMSFEKEVAELIWKFNRLGFDLEQDEKTGEIVIRTGMKFDKMDNLIMMDDEEIDETNDDKQEQIPNNHGDEEEQITNDLSIEQMYEILNLLDNNKKE